MVSCLTNNRKSKSEYKTLKYIQMSDVVKRSYKCIGCGMYKPCYLEITQTPDEFNYLFTDTLTCVLDASNRTGCNWEEVVANDADTGERQLTIPSVSVCTCCGNNPTHNESLYCIYCLYDKKMSGY